MLYYIILYYIILYYIIVYYIILYYIILYYIILYYTILYYIILYYTILYYIIFYSKEKPEYQLNNLAARCGKLMVPEQYRAREANKDKKYCTKLRVPYVLPPPSKSHSYHHSKVGFVTSELLLLKILVLVPASSLRHPCKGIRETDAGPRDADETGTEKVQQTTGNYTELKQGIGSRIRLCYRLDICRRQK